MLMDVDDRYLVERATEGDTEAFDALVAPERDDLVRFGVSILGDVHLAEDAVQEALAAAYASLAQLRQPEGFPGWLRGIVRFQCYRILRRRHALLVSLDHALELPASGPGPDELVEQSERGEAVRRAVSSLADGHRDVVELFYFGQLSQREIAGFLDMPISTVNNRLHAARQKLKGGLESMANREPQTKAAQTEENLGIVEAVHGVTFDVRFVAGQPQVLTGVEFMDAEGRGEASAVVAQRLPNGLVRCVAAIERRRPAPGSSVRHSGTSMLTPLSPSVVREALRAFMADRVATREARLIETGIKAVDLLCPVPQTGMLGVFGPAGAGKLVLIQELLHHLAAVDGELSIVDFAQAGPDIHRFFGVAREPATATGRTQTVYLAIDDPTDLQSATFAAASDHLDAVASMSHDMGREGLWPALDPVRCSSRLLDTKAVTAEHREVAGRSRDVIRRYRELRGSTHPDDVPALPPADRTIWERARRLQNFLTQPFFVATPYTGIPGQRVSLADTLAGCRAILEGQHDDVPEDVFLFVGAIDQASSRAERSSDVQGK